MDIALGKTEGKKKVEPLIYDVKDCLAVYTVKSLTNLHFKWLMDLQHLIINAAYRYFIFLSKITIFLFECP